MQYRAKQRPVISAPSRTLSARDTLFYKGTVRGPVWAVGDTIVDNVTGKTVVMSRRQLLSIRDQINDHGGPLMVEHDNTVGHVGRVNSAWMEGRVMWAEGKLNSQLTDARAGTFRASLSSLKLPCFSLGWNLVDPDDPAGDVMFEELTLCAKGRNPRAVIAEMRLSQSAAVPAVATRPLAAFVTAGTHPIPLRKRRSGKLLFTRAPHTILSRTPSLLDMADQTTTIPETAMEEQTPSAPQTQAPASTTPVAAASETEPAKLAADDIARRLARLEEFERREAEKNKAEIDRRIESMKAGTGVVHTIAADYALHTARAGIMQASVGQPDAQPPPVTDEQRAAAAKTASQFTEIWTASIQQNPSLMDVHDVLAHAASKCVNLGARVEKQDAEIKALKEANARGEHIRDRVLSMSSGGASAAAASMSVAETVGTKRAREDEGGIFQASKRPRVWSPFQSMALAGPGVDSPLSSLLETASTGRNGFTPATASLWRK